MLQRLIAKVKKIKRIRESNNNGLDIIEAEMKIRITDGIVKTKLPKGLKGKTETIFRRFVSFIPKEGDSLILTEEETERFLKEDVHTKRVIENRFLKAEVWEELGARIGSLIYKPKGLDVFSLYLSLQKSGWAYLGGILDTLSLEDFTDLWNKKYKYTSEGYEYKKGRLKILKKITPLKNLPAILIEYSVKSGIKKKIDLGQYLMIPVQGMGQKNVIYIPLQDRIEHFRYWRYISPWPWAFDYAGLKLGGFVYVNESKGICLGGFTQADRLEVVRLDRERNGFTGAFMFRREELKPDKLGKYRMVYVLGESFYMDKDSIAILARDTIMVRSVRKPVYLKTSVDGKEEKIKLSSRMIKGVGEFYISNSVPISGKIEGIEYEP